MTSSVRILLVEDSPQYESFLFSTLAKLGEVSRARSMIEAVAQCDRLVPHVIVLNAPIGGASSLTSLAELNDSTHKSPIIVLDRNRSEEHILDLRDAGANKVLPKPVNQRALEQSVKTAVKADNQDAEQETP